MEPMTVALTAATIFSPWQHVQWLQEVLKGKLRKQLWHVFPFSTWVRRTTLQSVYIPTLFCFFWNDVSWDSCYVLKPSLPINATLCLWHFYLSQFFCVSFKTVNLFCHLVSFSASVRFFSCHFLQTSAQAIFISIFDFCCNFVFRFCFFFLPLFLLMIIFQNVI